jgi:catechol 2,3-dioxygenase-like lactoylglutathione lyase family enzyme
MVAAITATKIVVSDVDRVARFYEAIGLMTVSLNTGGEGEVRQKQAWLRAGDDPAAHMLILSQFLEVPAPPLPAYPREFWMAFRVADVDDTIAAVEAAGGSVVRVGQDRTEHGVRAAVVADVEGHIIELVGPLSEPRA